MNTRLMSGKDENALLLAANILKGGGLVAFPTETVYGLGADALNPDASAKIYAAKGRPSDNPLIVHIAQMKSVYELAAAIPEKAKILMEAFWPGPLTLIFPKQSHVPDSTTGGLPTVAVRMPSHPVAKNLIEKSGVYIAAPSANLSGKPSPTKVSHVIEDLNGRIDLILDGGDVGIGIESTIVDFTGELPTILRPGFITKSMLEQMIGTVAVDRALREDDPLVRPKAPGMKYTHYAPQGTLTIVEKANKEADGSTSKEAGGYADAQAVIDKINDLSEKKQAEGFRVAVIASDEHAPHFRCGHVLTVGSYTKGETIAARLYSVLRTCDDLKIDFIFSESFDQGELGGAIMNRLLKAAGHRVIQV